MKKMLTMLWAFCVNFAEGAFLSINKVEANVNYSFAKVKFSALVSEMRNKLNGSVFSKNRAGNYLRNKVTPVNPQTVYQSQQRAWLTEASQSWRSLSDSDRLAWNSAVENFKKTDIFGDIKTPSGINLYNALYINAKLANVTPLSVPPAPTATPLAPDLSATVAQTGQVFDLAAGGPVPAGQIWIVKSSAGVSAGKQFIKNLLRQYSFMPSAQTFPVSTGTQYNNRFGALVAGERVGLEAYAIDTVTMLPSPRTRASYIVGA